MILLGVRVVYLIVILIVIVMKNRPDTTYNVDCRLMSFRFVVFFLFKHSSGLKFDAFCKSSSVSSESRHQSPIPCLRVLFKVTGPSNTLRNTLLPSKTDSISFTKFCQSKERLDHHLFIFLQHEQPSLNINNKINNSF